MPLSVALASIGLAIAPAVAASISIAGKLYRLYRARGNATLSHIPRVLDKISKELERTSKEFSAAQLQSFNDRLNGATLLYNALITDHSVVDAKTRKASFLEVKKSLIRLLEEIKTCAQQRAQDRLLRNMQTHLHSDQYVTYPNGTRATTRRGRLASQPFPTRNLPVAAHCGSEVVPLERLLGLPSPPLIYTQGQLSSTPAEMILVVAPFS